HAILEGEVGHRSSGEVCRVLADVLGDQGGEVNLDDRLDSVACRRVLAAVLADRNSTCALIRSRMFDSSSSRTGGAKISGFIVSRNEQSRLRGRVSSAQRDVRQSGFQSIRATSVASSRRGTRARGFRHSYRPVTKLPKCMPAKGFPLIL